MNDNTLRWLLEDDNPAIKYRTAVNICKNEQNYDLEKLYSSIWKDKAVARMLSRQDKHGSYESERRYYGSFLSLRYLTAFAEYGLYKDIRLTRLVDQTINDLLKSPEKDLSGCAIPLILRALVMLGYHEDINVQYLMQNFFDSQLYDGGFMCKRMTDKKPGRKSCYKASVAALLLYGECKRKNITPANTNLLLGYFLNRNVFYNSEKTKMFNEGRYGWRFIDNFFPSEPMRTGLPLILSALSVLGVGSHPALEESWLLLHEKMNIDGKFDLEGTLSKQPCSFGPVGKPNKWITYYALLAENER